ncbi:MAG: glycosyltransferase family 39 protein [Cyanobacteria bacterium J06597_1]
MNNRLSQTGQRYFCVPPATLRWFVTVLLIVGIVLRLVNLDLKVYAHDEVYTSLRVSGYVGEEVSEAIRDRYLTIEELLQYQDPGDRSWGDTLHSLATHPEHPPLFYLLERGWISIFGSSVTSFRALPAVISLFLFPAIYWLCLELFESPTTGWFAIGLLAVSPFHVLFAQEARQYSLWALLTIVSSAALLRGMRTQNASMWWLFWVSSMLNFYTALLAPLLTFGHGLYVLVMEKWRPTKTVRRFVVAAVAAGIGFLPWLYVVYTGWTTFQTKTGWLNNDKTLPHLIRLWGLHLNTVFVDVPLGPETFGSRAISIAATLLVLLAFGQLIRKSSLRVWLLPVSAFVFTSFPLILSDILKDGQRSSQTRYFAPALIVLVVVTADMLARWWTSDRRRPQQIGTGLLCVLLTCGVLSSVKIAMSDVWWNKAVSFTVPEESRFINQYEDPLIVAGTSSISMGNLIALGHKLDPDTQLYIAVDTMPEIPEDAEPVFLSYANDDLKEYLRQTEGAQLDRVAETGVYLRWVRRPSEELAEGDS